MQASFTIPMPPMLNEQIRIARANHYHSAAIKKKWTGKVASYCYKLPKFTGQVWLSFDWQLRRFTTVDQDNAAASSKFIMDGMVSAGMLVDDSLKFIQSPVVHWYSKGNNLVTITVSDSPIFKLEAY